DTLSSKGAGTPSSVTAPRNPTGSTPRSVARHHRRGDATASPRAVHRPAIATFALGATNFVRAGMSAGRALASGLLVTLASLALVVTPRPAAAQMSEQEAYEIGVEAYIYLYPLLTMDITRKVLTNHEAGKAPGMGPMNSLSHIRAFPPADFRQV